MSLLKEIYVKDELPYDKFLKFGPEHLSDAELLAIMLRTGTKDRTPIELGREILQLAGEKRGLLGLHHFSVKELTGPSRAAKVVFARYVCMHLMYNLLEGISLQQIGAILGGRNHATIIHGIKKISERAGEDNELLGSIDNLKKELQNSGITVRI